MSARGFVHNRSDVDLPTVDLDFDIAPRDQEAVMRLLMSSQFSEAMHKALLDAYEMGAERALLERDVADVGRYLHDCREGAAHWDDAAREVRREGPADPTPEDVRQMDESVACLLGLAQGWRDHEATCQAWLARAKAVLG